MKVLVIDLEATDRTPETARITEITYCLWDTDIKQQLALRTTLVCPNDDVGFEYPEEVQALTGISKKMIADWGVQTDTVLKDFVEFVRGSGATHVVSHNLLRYDGPLLRAEFKRCNVDMGRLSELCPIDTLIGICGLGKFDSHKLKYLCADHGIFPIGVHRSTLDVVYLCALISKYKFEDIEACVKQTRYIVRALVSYDLKDKARELGFRWQEINGKKFEKSWVSMVTKSELDTLKTKACFEIAIISEEIPSTRFG